MLIKVFCYKTYLITIIKFFSLNLWQILLTRCCPFFSSPLTCSIFISILQVFVQDWKFWIYFWVVSYQLLFWVRFWVRLWNGNILWIYYLFELNKKYFTIKGVLAEWLREFLGEPSEEEQDDAVKDAYEHFEQKYALLCNFCIEPFDDVREVPFHGLKQEDVYPRI